MLRAVDHAHAAPADPLLDAVTGDLGAEAWVFGFRHDASIMDDALAGTRVLIAGGDAGRRQGAAARAWPPRPRRSRWPPDAEAAAQAALAARPRRDRRDRRRRGASCATGSTRSSCAPAPPLLGAADARRRREGRARRRGAAARAARPRRAASAAARPRVARWRPRPSRAGATSSRRASRRCGGSRSPPSTATTTRASTRERVGRARRPARPAARALGAREVTHIRHAAPLHDVGKIAIPDSILLKPGRLTADEFEVVKTHAEARRARARRAASRELLEVAERDRPLPPRALGRHRLPRRPGGRRHPARGRGSSHVADVFDVLVHERPYKEACQRRGRRRGDPRAAPGTQFDPEVVEAFADLGPRVWLAAPGVYGG